MRLVLRRVSSINVNKGPLGKRRNTWASPGEVKKRKKRVKAGKIEKK